MTDENTGELPKAPPSAAPSRRTSPWAWAAITAGAILATCVVAVTGGLVWALVSTANEFKNGFDMEEAMYYVEQESVVEAVEKPCSRMTSAAKHIRLLTSRAKGVKSLADWAESAKEIVAAIDSAEPDEQSTAWRNDWSKLIASVEAFTRSDRSANAHLTIPKTAGVAVTERMYFASDADCEVPIVIVALDPTAAAEYIDY